MSSNRLLHLPIKFRLHSILIFKAPNLLFIQVLFNGLSHQICKADQLFRPSTNLPEFIATTLVAHSKEEGYS